MNYFEEAAKQYAPQWQELSARKFEDKEIALIQKCTVEQGNFDRSVCFLMKNGNKVWTPIEKSSIVKYSDEMNVGDSLDIKRMMLVHMKYTGNDPKYKVKETFKIRYMPAEDTPSLITSFDNPFGV